MCFNLCSGLNFKRLSAMVVAGFVFTFLYEAVVHGVLLKGVYEETMSLWRTPEEMQAFFPLTLVFQLLMVAFLALIFTRNYEDKGCAEGVRFGLLIGLYTGIGQAALYCYMPIPCTLAAAWFGATLVYCVIIGLIFAVVYKGKK